jgi:hypothetical protein
VYDVYQSQLDRQSKLVHLLLILFVHFLLLSLICPPGAIPWARIVKVSLAVGIFRSVDVVLKHIDKYLELFVCDSV